jgi:hypothetical protein
MIIGRDLMTKTRLVLNFDTQCITWDGIDEPKEHTGGAK